MPNKETAWAPFEEFEAKDSGDTGVVEGYASVFGDRDHGRDRVMPGAFQKSLADRGQHVVYIPSHDYKVHVKDIPAVPQLIKEDSKGLYTKTMFFLGTQAGKDSFTVIREYQRAGRPLGMSYTFRPVDFDLTQKGRDLKAVDLFEYGHTALPMLDSARTVSAKSYTEDETKEMVTKGEAMDDGAYPIKDEEDLIKAIEDSHQAKDVYAARTHIRKRAKDLGKEGLIPEDWKSLSAILVITSTKSEDLVKDFEGKLGKPPSEAQSTKITEALTALQSLLADEKEEANTDSKTDEEKLEAKKRKEIEDALQLVRLG